jgi:hypothetical protein
VYLLVSVYECVGVGVCVRLCARAYAAQMAQVLLQQPMPPDYAHWRADVLCNDCVKRASVPYHFLGHQCPDCGGFNTAVIKLDRRLPAYMPAEAADVDGSAPAQRPATAAVAGLGAGPGWEIVLPLDAPRRAAGSAAAPAAARQASPVPAAVSLLGRLPWLQGRLNEVRGSAAHPPPHASSSDDDDDDDDA